MLNIATCDIVYKFLISVTVESFEYHIVSGSPHGTVPIISFRIILRMIGRQGWNTVRTFEFGWIVKMGDKTVKSVCGNDICKKRPVCAYSFDSA